MFKHKSKNAKIDVPIRRSPCYNIILSCSYIIILKSHNFSVGTDEIRTLAYPDGAIIIKISDSEYKIIYCAVIILLHHADAIARIITLCSAHRAQYYNARAPPPKKTCRPPSV